MEDTRGQVLGAAGFFMNTALAAAGKFGSSAAHFQVYDGQPDGPGDRDIETIKKQLGRDAARRDIAERFRSGFEGIAGFACIDESSGNTMLRVEAFDTRHGNAAGLTMQLKKRFGKYQPVAKQPTLDPTTAFPTARAE